MSLLPLVLPLLLLGAAIYAARRAAAHWYGDKVQAGVVAILAGVLLLGAAFTTILDVLSAFA